MMERPQEAKESKTEAHALSSNFAGLIDDRHQVSAKNDSQSVLKADTASAILPNLVVNSLENHSQKSMQTAKALGELNYLMPEDLQPRQDGGQVKIGEEELQGTFGDQTKHALMKDADLYAPVHNADGSTTYTVVQSGITDRTGSNNGIDYYRRNVEVTVPTGGPGLDNCTYVMSPREVISKDEFDKLLERDKAASPEVELYAHGVNATDSSADHHALMLELSNGRPIVNLDWNSKHVTGPDPFDHIDAYANDTIACKRANDNKQFQSAIDSTIGEIGADHTSMVGFSQGGFFDARYLAHRVASELPSLKTVILAHPDVPISAPEFNVNGKPELLKDAAQQSYVIGGSFDLALQSARVASTLPQLWDTPTYEEGSEERIGDDADDTRALIRRMGAVPISESDRDEPATEHFLNFAGVRELLNAGNQQLVGRNIQADYNTASIVGRQA